MKYIIVTGGVISGVGKGIVASSIAALLQSKGTTVTMIKIDPYLNVHAGTFSPEEHGEVFVLSDGGEVDLDFGNYQRILDLEFTKFHNITGGKVYLKNGQLEQGGYYKGKTVQAIPHLTGMILNGIRYAAFLPIGVDKKIAEVCIIELGGTIGDIESRVFEETLKRLSNNDVFNVHTTLLVGEFKTRPSQFSIAGVKSCGMIPDLVILRSTEKCTVEDREKVAQFAVMPLENVLNLPDVKSLYRVPQMFDDYRIFDLIHAKLNLYTENPNRKLKMLNEFAQFEEQDADGPKICVIGKYSKFKESYTSIFHALSHSSFELNTKFDIDSIKVQDVDKKDLNSIYQEHEDYEKLKSASGILMAGGFGIRGTKSLIDICKFARANKIPFLGICFGFQIALIEFGKNEMKINATSEEFENYNQTAEMSFNEIWENDLSNLKFKNVKNVKNARNAKLQNFQEKVDYIFTDCGEMRLGKSDVMIERGILRNVYKQDVVKEIHRHRYIFNEKYEESYKSFKVNITGRSFDGKVVEAFELPKEEHPYYVGVQFHPEYSSTLFNASPIITSFLSEALIKSKAIKDV